MPRKLAAPVFQGLPLTDLLPAFMHYLEDGNRSPHTRKQYAWAVRGLHAWLEGEGLPHSTSDVTESDARAYQRHLLATRSDATADASYRALRVFFAWAVTDGEMRHNPIENAPRPKVQVKPVDIIPPDTARRLFKACEGNGFDAVRDMAILRLLWDSGGRRAEIGGLSVNDVHFESNTATVTGKGNKVRAIPFTATTARALRRYLTMARPRHPDAHYNNLWLGANGRMTPDGIRHVLDKRTAAAGLPHIRPHQFRNTLAHRYLAAGGNQNNLMLLMGWSSPQMVARYVASTATELAHSEYHRLELDEF